MKLIYYRNNGKVYFANAAMNYGNVRGTCNLSNLYNGQEAKPTFSKVWYCVDGDDITSVQIKRHPKTNLLGFELKDANKHLASDAIPESLTKEQVDQYWCDDDDVYLWGNPLYKDLQKLYEPVYETVEEGYEEVEFEAEFLGEISVDNPLDFPSMKISVLKDSQWRHNGTKEVDLSSITRWSELEEMFTPEFLLYTRPCSLTSKQTYEIVRNHVKENINPKQAIITSDYNFCFTVKKKVSVKPYTHKWEEKKANGKSYARPRIHSKQVTDKQVEIFSMTHKSENYKGYTAIEGFKGESLEDLIENMRLYLSELMTYVNEPVSECNCCKGTGHIVGSFDKNKR